MCRGEPAIACSNVCVMTRSGGACRLLCSLLVDGGELEEGYTLGTRECFTKPGDLQEYRCKVATAVQRYLR